LKNDLLRVRYDPGRVTPAQMLQTIDKQGYEAKEVPDSGPTGPR
jgi:hypothetical protein